MLLQLRRTIIVACLLFILDAFFLNQFLIAGLTILIGIPLFLVKLFRRRKDPERRKILVARAMVYACMVVLIIAAFQSNAHLAERRAQGIIAACEHFHSQRGAYPDKLIDLVPAYIPSIPAAKISMTSDHFFYMANDGDHSLCYTTVPPYGARCYQLEQRKWRNLAD